MLQGEVKADKAVKISLKSLTEERQELHIAPRRAEQVASFQNLYPVSLALPQN